MIGVVASIPGGYPGLQALGHAFRAFYYHAMDTASPVNFFTRSGWTRFDESIGMQGAQLEAGIMKRPASAKACTEEVRGSSGVDILKRPASAKACTEELRGSSAVDILKRPAGARSSVLKRPAAV